MKLKGRTFRINPSHDNGGFPFIRVLERRNRRELLVQDLHRDGVTPVTDYGYAHVGPRVFRDDAGWTKLRTYWSEVK